MSRPLNIHFKRPESWRERVYIYCWDLLPPPNYIEKWPGVPMGSEPNNWYVHMFNTAREAKLIFNDGTNKTDNLYCDNTAWFYTDGRWYDSNPELNQNAKQIQMAPAPAGALASSQDLTSTSEQPSRPMKTSRKPKRFGSDAPQVGIAGQIDAHALSASSSRRVEADGEDSRSEVPRPEAAPQNARNLRKCQKERTDMEKEAEKTRSDEDTKATRAVEVVIRGVEVPEELLRDEDKDFFARSLAKFRRVPFSSATETDKPGRRGKDANNS